MPMPFAFRMYLLDNWLQSGVIDLKEYRRRQMFAVARDMSSPDDDQEARAKRIADAIRMRLPAVPQMRWTDDEAIHQDVLQREILLQDDLDQDIIDAAQERWDALASQAATKQGGATTPPGMGEPSSSGGPAAASVPPIPPGQLPLAATNPVMGVTGMLQQGMTGMPDAEFAAQQADLLSRQS